MGGLQIEDGPGRENQKLGKGAANTYLRSGSGMVVLLTPQNPMPQDPVSQAPGGAVQTSFLEETRHA